MPPKYRPMTRGWGRAYYSSSGSERPAAGEVEPGERGWWPFARAFSSLAPAGGAASLLLGRQGCPAVASPWVSRRRVLRYAQAPAARTTTMTRMFAAAPSGLLDWPANAG